MKSPPVEQLPLYSPEACEPLNRRLTFVESTPMTQPMGFSSKKAHVVLPTVSQERKEAVPMHTVKMATTRHKIEVLSKEHCSSCSDALASAAHELKTPLAIMGGYLHLLLAEKLGPLNARQVEVLSEIQANGVRLS